MEALWVSTAGKKRRLEREDRLSKTGNWAAMHSSVAAPLNAMGSAILTIMCDDRYNTELFADAQLTGNGGRVLPGSSATKQDSNWSPQSMPSILTRIYSQGLGLEWELSCTVSWVMGVRESSHHGRVQYRREKQKGTAEKLNYLNPGWEVAPEKYAMDEVACCFQITTDIADLHNVYHRSKICCMTRTVRTTKHFYDACEMEGACSVTLRKENGQLQQIRCVERDVCESHPSTGAVWRFHQTRSEGVNTRRTPVS